MVRSRSKERTNPTTEHGPLLLPKERTHRGARVVNKQQANKGVEERKDGRDGRGREGRKEGRCRLGIHLSEEREASTDRHQSTTAVYSLSSKYHIIPLVQPSRLPKEFSHITLKVPILGDTMYKAFMTDRRPLQNMLQDWIYRTCETS